MNDHPQLVQRKRREPDARKPGRIDRLLEQRSTGRRLASKRREHDRRTAGRATQRERQRARRLSIDPLDVVDGDERRRLGRRQQSAHREAERRCIRTQRRLRPLKGGVERETPRARKLVERIGDRFEEVRECREAEFPLGGGRLRLQHAETALARTRDTVSPDRGLADTRLSLDQQHTRPAARTFEERIDRSDLVRAPEERPSANDRHQGVLRCGCRRSFTRP